MYVYFSLIYGSDDQWQGTVKREQKNHVVSE